ncbi:thioredoxin-like protein [Rhizoctonia solani]|nr:thioredoxin-like protein [Rhizoctonia solani]
MIVRSFIILSRRTLSTTTRRPPPRSLKFFPLASPFATTSSGPSIQQKLDMSAQQIVDAAIAARFAGKKHIVIFSKSYCPYCAKAKSQIEGFTKTLSQSEKDQLEVDILELDQRDDGSAIQDYLETKTQQRTVPNIFIGNKHIGGSSDLAPYSNDKIKETLFAV